MGIEMTISLVVLYLALPALILYLCVRYPAINKISPVLLSYDAEEYGINS